MGIATSSNTDQRKKSLVIQVAHFTPASFPLMPIITGKSNELCKDSWRKIVSCTKSDDKSQESSGITRFYNEFYERLDADDFGGEFDKIISNNTKGKNKIFAKGSLIIRIIDYILKIDADTKELRDRLTKLGAAHVQLKIHPWQYSIFVETLLQTISSCLQEEASHEVMESWVNLFALVFKYMLPAALKGGNETLYQIPAHYGLKSKVPPSPKSLRSKNELNAASNENSVHSRQRVCKERHRKRQHFKAEVLNSASMRDNDHDLIYVHPIHTKKTNSDSNLLNIKKKTNFSIQNQSLIRTHFPDNNSIPISSNYSRTRPLSNTKLNTTLTNSRSIGQLYSNEELIFEQYIELDENTDGGNSDEYLNISSLINSSKINLLSKSENDLQKNVNDLDSNNNNSIPKRKSSNFIYNIKSPVNFFELQHMTSDSKDDTEPNQSNSKSISDRNSLHLSAGNSRHRSISFENVLDHMGLSNSGSRRTSYSVDAVAVDGDMLNSTVSNQKKSPSISLIKRSNSNSVLPFDAE